MTTPTNARQASERERLVLPMTASMVPHPMYASGWNACLDACKEVLDCKHAEIEHLRAENEALRTVTEEDVLNFRVVFPREGTRAALQSFIRSKEGSRG